MPTLDTTAPNLLSVSPSNNGSGVAVGTVIVLQFTEAVKAGTGSFTVTDGITQSYIGRDGQPGSRIVGASDTRTFPVADGQVSISGNTVTITLDAPLKGGLNYSVTATKGAITDIAGNAFSGLSDTSQFHFETSAPVLLNATVTSIDISDDTGASSSDFITAHSVQSISGNYSGTLHAGEYVEVSFDNGASWHTASAASGSWSLVGTLPAGSNTLAARVSNGSTSTSALEQEYKVDAIAPAVASLALSDTSLEAGDTATLTLVLTEKLQAPLSAADFSTVGGHLDGLSVSADGLTWTGTFTSTNLAGSGSISFNASGAQQDTAGNAIGSGASVAFSSAVTLSTTLSSDSGYSATDFITRYASQTVRVTYGAALSGGDKIQIGIDGNWADALWDGTQWARSGVTLGDSGVVQTRIVDASGSTVKAITSKAYQVDTGAPSASLSGDRLDLLDGCDTGYSHTDNLTAESQPTLRVDMAGVTGLQAGDVVEIFDNSNDNIVLGHYVLTAADLGASGQYLAGNLTIDLIDGSISQGDAHSIKVRIGNLAQSGHGAASDALDIRVDHTAPVVVSTTPTAAGTGANLAAITLRFDEDVYLNVGTSFRLANDAGTEVQEFNGEAAPSHYMYDSATHALDILLHAGLQNSTHYTLTASSGLGDYAGNKVYEVDDVVLSFTTTATGTIVLDPTLALQDDTGAGGDFITSNGQLNIGSLDSGGRWKYSLDGGASWTWGDSSDAHLHLAANSSYAAGQIKVQQWTADNNYSAIVSNGSAITIDSSAPTATIDFAEVDNFFGLGATSLTIGDIRLGGTVGGALVQYTLDGGGSWSSATPDGVHTVWTASGNLAMGGYIGLRVADLAGNVADNGFAAAPGAYTVFIGDGYGGSEFATGHDSILLARGGNDLFSTADGSFRYIDGGGDSDTLRLSGSGLDLDAAGWQGKLLNVETIALGSGNSLTVHDAAALQAIAGGSTLKIDGDSGSILDIGEGLWTLGGTSAGYSTLTAGGMSLLVKSGISLLGNTVSAVATPAMVFTDSSPMSGGYGADRITADSSFSVSGLESGGHWKYSTNGGSTWLDGSGSSFTLAEGTYAAGQVKIQQWNASEAPSAVASNSAAFTVDTTAPAGTLDYNFAIDSDIAIAASGLSSGAIVEYSADGGSSWQQAVLEGDGKWHAHNAGVGTGGYLGVQISDVAGNLGGAPVYVGDNYAGSFTGSSGAVVLGNGGADTLDSADAGFLRFEGGSGTDTLHITGSGQSLDLASLAGKLDSVEVIDLGSGINTLMAYSPANAGAIAGGMLTIEGSSGTVDIGHHNWLLDLLPVAGYHVFLLGGTTLRVADNLSIVGDTILLA
ncbi:beta strand repeat-containing protein [Pseudoduganella rhizocola]|uniref:beta strand repeat-containing protein n=1 Tax=Pseudoduganella rhizocola TaxID=3382643 RepID=UPI0038B5EC62